MAIFEFVGQFLFQNVVFKLQEAPEYSLIMDLKVSGISYFTDFRQIRGAKKISKTVLKTRLKRQT
jgi:hypothetical protein